MWILSINFRVEIDQGSLSMSSVRGVKFKKCSSAIHSALLQFQHSLIVLIIDWLSIQMFMVIIGFCPHTSL